MAMATRKDLVSIIIPTYKRPQEVREAAKSALAQTWGQVEVVVVSDGPDPETRAALEGLDTRLLYMEMAVNGGPAAARNAGVKASSGTWLTFLDDDDSMLPNKIAEQMRLADAADPGTMIACRTIYRHGGREDIWPNRPIDPEEDLGDYLLRRPSVLGRPGVIPIQTLLVHRSLIRKLPFSTHKDHEDWAWLLEIWHLHGARVRFVWEPLVVYNVATEAISRSRRTNWEESLAWAEQYRSWISDRAFCSFLATKVALKAKRAGDGRGLRRIAGSLFRAHFGVLDVLFLAGIAALPSALLHQAWKRSLRSEENTTSAAPRPQEA